MKKIALFLAVVLPLMAFTSHYLNAPSVKDEIEKLVVKSYINGAFNDLDYEAMSNGFHEDFAIFSAKGEKLARYEIEDWVAGVKERRESPDFNRAENQWEYKLPMIDITETSAIVKVELFKDGKHVFTDYLSLLKFESGWKIVGKVYTRH